MLKRNRSYNVHYLECNYIFKYVYFYVVLMMSKNIKQSQGMPSLKNFPFEAS